MSVATAEVPGRVVMHGVSWASYEQLLDALQEQQVRVSYDRGRLEIMSPSRLHERIKHLLVLLVAAISRDFGIPVHGFGSATFRRAGLARGVEADEWYYIAAEAAVRGKDDIDLDVDPPPDLAIEIDITSTIDARLPIYSALEVHEIWVWRAGIVRFLLRGADGDYTEAETSGAFPFLKSAALTQFLGQRHTTDETTFIEQFVESLHGADDTNAE